ncbi:hypothetical protein [Pasteuria penetrans]|uniref:hypothetical protein n=1 Tax=Pasteuria penetrans TaxID=86005 RepID=UPI001CAA7249|nr:hypothetical protein [Pasteuria penetrans]
MSFVGSVGRRGGTTPPPPITEKSLLLTEAIRVSRSRSRDEGCSALRNRLIGSRLQTA